MNWALKNGVWHRIKSYNADIFFLECGEASGRAGRTEMDTLDKPPANGVICADCAD